MAQYYSPNVVLTESLSAVTGTPGRQAPSLGTRLWADGKEWIYVYNEGTSQASPGYGLTVNAVSGCVSPYSCTVSSNSGSPLVGVVVHATLTTATYGWVCSKGVVPAMPGSSYAVGIPLALDLNGVFVTAIVTAIHQGVAIPTVTGVTGTATSAMVYGQV